MATRGWAIAVFVMVVAGLGVTESIWEYWTSGLIRQAEKKASEFSGGSLSYPKQSLVEEIAGLRQAWLDIQPIGKLLPEVHYNLGRATLVLSLATASRERKISLFCEALDEFKTASGLSPHSPKYHIAWADIHGQLENPAIICKNPSKFNRSDQSFSPSERLKHAEELAPLDGVDLYLSAIANMGLGNKTEALKLLRSNQEVNPYFTRGQLIYTTHLVTNNQELLTAIPRRYPMVINWVNYFENERPRDFLAWKSTFQTATQDAISDVVTRFRSDQLSPENFGAYLKQISALSLTQSSDKLRQRLDDLLEQVYKVEKNPGWAKILSKRKSLELVPAAKSLIDNDLKPNATMLHSWVSADDASIKDFDILGRAIGMHIHPGYQLQMVVIENQGANARIPLDSIKILVSNDNLTYHPYGKRPPVSHHVFDGREGIVIEFSDSGFRYLKLVFTGSNQRPRFKNGFPLLLQPYGTKTTS